jgi:hypothetical protein
LNKIVNFLSKKLLNLKPQQEYHRTLPVWWRLRSRFAAADGAFGPVGSTCGAAIKREAFDGSCYKLYNDYEKHLL